MGTPATARRLADGGEHGRIGTRRRHNFLQRGQQALGAHRLQQVVDGIEVECLHRVVVVGGDENDGGRVLESAEMAGQFDAIHARHADVGKDDIDRAFANELERRDAVAGLADDLAGELDSNIAQQLAQPRAGQRFVVDQEDFQRLVLRHGRMMRTS